MPANEPPDVTEILQRIGGAIHTAASEGKRKITKKPFDQKLTRQERQAIRKNLRARGFRVSLGLCRAFQISW